MSEKISYIPSRVKNCAEGGHVAGARDIIDDGSGITLDELVGNKKYDSADFSSMGRVVLKKNIVNGVNTLTQDMFYKGEVGSREPNTNTIYIIQYDFTLGEDITIPANCVLEFDGGSISGNNTITGTNTLFSRNIKCLVTIAGTFSNDYLDITWFGAVGDDNTDCIGVVKNVFSVCVASKRDMYVPKGIYAFNSDRFDFGSYSGGDPSDWQPETYYDCNDITVFGDGMYSSIFNSHTLGDVLNIACAKNIKFKNIGITVDKDFVVTGSTGINCISLINTCNMIFDHVYCAGGQSITDAIGLDGGFGFTIQSDICDNIKLYNCHMKNCFGGFDLCISNEALNREETNIELHSCIAEKCERGYWIRGYTTRSISPFIKGGLGYIQGKVINCMHSVMLAFDGYDININVINTETIDNIIKDYKGNYYWPQASWTAKNFRDVSVHILNIFHAHNNNIKIDAFAKEIHCGCLVEEGSTNNTCHLTLNNDATLKDMYVTSATQMFKTEFISIEYSEGFYILNCKESEELLLYVYSLIINQDVNNIIVLNNVLYSKDSCLRKIQFINTIDNRLSKVDLSSAYGYYPMFNNKDTNDRPVYKCFEVGQAGSAFGGMNAFGDLLRSTISDCAPYGGVDPEDIAGGFFIDVRDVNDVNSVLGHIQVSKKNKGTTADRPSLTTSNSGYFYYDTTINKPIWWNGSAWVDAAGVQV